MYRRYVKRIIDVILSLVGLILASWLYLLIMIAIEIDDPGPVFFSQKRVGIHKKYFQLYKFRSMKMSIFWRIRSSTSHGWGNSCARHRWMRFRSSGTFCGVI